MTVYLTGDTHGHFERIERFVRAHHVGERDVVVILGDAGVNYFGKGSARDLASRQALARLAPTFLCIHGNHEMRPQSVGGYREMPWRGGIVYVEDGWPNILFAKDGELYDLEGTSTFVVGGAYSLDKAFSKRWFSDEQPSDEVKRHVEERLDAIGWQVDAVLTHTCPLSMRPVESFVAGISQDGVDLSTETWLQQLEERLAYRHWYFGHFHISKRAERYQAMFDDWDVLWPHGRTFDPAEHGASPIIDRRTYAQLASDLGVEETAVEAFFSAREPRLYDDFGRPVCRERSVGSFLTDYYLGTDRWQGKHLGTFELGQCEQCRRWYHRSKLSGKRIEGCPEDDQPLICDDCLHGIRPE